ncbi:unnamed protein product (macronuclear) [Paramecium tetraurelia]|uniref:Ion transport domain-containing protein n=1 Tax=Paramecium tetraurelia TaxID=5888 RepID=A0BJ71_PARTE|nr:uncharacterized protein GSPATT00004961001 [Paramecium tetraurelia]CAK58588.1 unnamed protein product [Paramecium tetraurelia]|eukprot:XP_001425986.1 hypothetical protein (macronuclear) [Paramecium tetraurelia strain d4-2]
MSNNKERFYEQKSQHQESQESQPSREIKKDKFLNKTKINDSPFDQKVEIKQFKKAVSQKSTVGKARHKSQIIQTNQTMKESMKQSNQSKSIQKSIHKNNSNQQMKSPQTEEHLVSKKPIKEEQSESEMNSVFNIEQEDSIIKLNDQFQRQASKQAFAQLYELDDCLEEMQEKNYIRNQIENTKIRKIDNIDQILRKEEWAEEKEKVAQLDFNPELEYQQLIDQKNLNHSINLRVSHNFQWLKKEVSYYQDGLRFLFFRKIIVTIIISIEILCYKLLQSTIFDLYEMLVTLANIILFLNRSPQESPKISEYQYLFCVLYFIDAFIHLAGQGFKKYIQSFWNIYDLLILVLYLLYILQNHYIPFDVSTFRLIRIPIYVGRISNKLNIILLSIKEAVKQIVENLLILILFTILIAIFMLYAFNGVLKYRCMHEELGIFSLNSYEIAVCGYKECEIGFVCARQLQSIDVPTNFDNILFAYFQTIRTSIVNDWTITMYMLMKQFNPFVCILYVFIIFAINKFYFQLLIAVLKVYYHKTQEYYINNPVKPEFSEDQIKINMSQLLETDIWKTVKMEIFNYQNYKFNTQYRLDPKSRQQKLSMQPIQEHNNVKYLSARQQIDQQNERELILKQNTHQSWIISFYFPYHQLQSQIQNLINNNESKFSHLETFYTLRSLDYLSIYTEVRYNVPYDFASIQDIQIQEDPKKKQKEGKIMKKQHLHQQYFIVQKVQNNFKTNDRPKPRFPYMKKTVHMHNDEEFFESLGNSSMNESSMQSSSVKQNHEHFQQQKMGNNIFVIYSQQESKQQNPFQKKNKNQKLLQMNTQSRTSINPNQFNLNYDDVVAMINLKLKNETISITNYEEVYEQERNQSQEGIYLQQWSGSDLIERFHFESVVQYLNKYWNYYFLKGIRFYLIKIQYQLYYFITNQIIQILLDGFVCLNILILTFSDFYDQIIADYFDLIVTILLFLETILKVLTIHKYLQNFTNVLSVLIITFILIERILFFSLFDEQEPTFEIFIYIKILKSLFFFRVIKYNTFAQNMIMISYQTFPNYAVMALLLLFLMLNYAIFSLQIFDFPEFDELKMYHYFGNIYQSWIAVYDISTGDDWYGVVILSTTYGIYYIGFLFCISLVFIVNYFGFGLSFVIILDGFANYLDSAKESETQSIEEKEQSVVLNFNHYDSEIRKESLVKKDNNNINLKSLLETLIEPENKEKYYNIQNEYSLFIIQKSNSLRKTCFMISEIYPIKLLLCFVLWSSLINLILITYYDETDQNFWNPFEIIQCLFNLLILIDAIIQIITYGAIAQDGYFSSIWVSIDFAYVVTYFLYLASNHSALKWILYLGYLRPLKVTSTYGFFVNERGAIMKSFSDILRIFYVILLFWFIFAIFGMTIYKDKLGYCDSYFNYGVGRQDCQGEWKVYPHNFNNIIEAMQSLFIISTLDGWGITFFVCINSASEQTGPIRFNNEWISYLFFFSFTFIGALFFLQFFAGVIFVNFQQNKQQLLNPDLTLDQELFLKLTEIIMLDTPNYSKPPKKGLRLKAKILLENSSYILITKLSLILNLFTLMLFYEQGSTRFLQTLNWLNHFFSFILLIDCILKLFTYHIKRYFDDIWRQMQLIFVLLSLLDFYIDIYRDDPYFIWLRIFILNRCLRMSLIIQQFTRIRKLLNVIYFNKMAILRILGLFITVLSCYSYVGCALFGEANSGSILNDQLNFNNFFFGLLASFKCTTENGWRFIFVDSQNYMKQQNKPWVLASVFYYSLIFIGARVLMNLIVCELVQEFEKFYDTSSSCLETYVETIDKFRTLWCKYTEEFQGTKMQTKYLGHFLLDLEEPLGALKGDNIWDAAKKASSFELKKDFAGCLTFRNLLYEVFKQAFKESVFKITTEAGKTIMKENDKKIKYRLYNQRSHHFRRERVNEKVDIQSNFNILQEYLYLKMALKAWRSFSEHFFIVAGEVQNTIDFTESDVDAQISSENSQIEGFDVDEPQKQIKRLPSKEHLRRPTDVYILPYYDEIKFKDKNLKSILKATDQQQQKVFKSISIVKKKEQLIQYKEYNKRRDAIDKPTASRNRYQYGYHEKITRQQLEEKSDNRLLSRFDPTKMPSAYNITKIASKLK